MSAWLSVIGIGEEGLDGLSGPARALVEGAEVLVGGERHLALVPETAAERLPWRQPLGDTIALIEERRGRHVVVLASGDPLHFGVASLLARHFAAGEIAVLPHLSAFSLAASRLLWPLEECIALSLHARPLDALRLHLAPGARILALSGDGDTPVQVAELLRDSGWGPSAMTVFAHMGGPRERRIDGIAESWPLGRIAALNTIALDCRPGPRTRPLSRLAGLPDDAFEHDGQLTKREVRAATLARLVPLPGHWPPNGSRETFVIVAASAPPVHALPVVPSASVARFLRSGRSVVLTDDHAPVDQLLAPVFGQSLALR